MEVQRFESQILQPCTKRWLSLWTQRKPPRLPEEAKTGKLMWRGKKYSYGRILLDDKHLLILGHSGVFSVVEASPDDFREISSRQLLSDARCWNGPAFVNGYLLARNGEQIACFDFGK